eukprot:1121810_1
MHWTILERNICICKRIPIFIWNAHKSYDYWWCCWVSGSFSCSNISFITSGQTITCSGASSCSHITSIASQNEINCDGSNACSYTTFDSVPFPYIACRGDKSCAHS